MYTLAGGTCPANDIGPTQKVVHFVERWVTVRGRVCLLSLLRSKLHAVLAAEMRSATQHTVYPSRCLAQAYASPTGR
jgi:hypothetical protein